MYLYYTIKFYILKITYIEIRDEGPHLYIHVYILHNT
jgi:hypothetical protein